MVPQDLFVGSGDPVAVIGACRPQFGERFDEVVHPLPQRHGASEDHAEHVIPLREPSELPEIDSIGVHGQLPTRDAPLDKRLLD